MRIDSKIIEAIVEFETRTGQQARYTYLGDRQYLEFKKYIYTLPYLYAITVCNNGTYFHGTEIIRVYKEDHLDCR